MDTYLSTFQEIVEGMLQSIGSQRIIHDSAAEKNSNSIHICGTFPGVSVVKNSPANQKLQVWFLGWEIPWRKKWQLTPVFWPGKFHGNKMLESYSSWVHRVRPNLKTKQEQQHTYMSMCVYIYIYTYTYTLYVCMYRHTVKYVYMYRHTMKYVYIYTHTCNEI